MTVRVIIYLALSLLLVVGCKSKKEGQEIENLRKRSSKYILEKMDRYHLDAEWVNLKGTVRLNQNDKSIKADAYIRMRKDSVIWAAVKKIGFEAGRVLITTDSVFLINRLEKTYFAQPISYIRDMMGLSSSGDRLSDFRNLYDLVLGNPLFLTDSKYNVNVKSPHYQLSKSISGLETEYWVNGKEFTLHKMHFTQMGGNRSAMSTQEDYKSLGVDQLFSYIRKLNLYSPETGKLDVGLNFKKVTINKPVSIRFSIPKSYERID